MAPPPSQNVRLTITVTPEVHEAFVQLSKASGISISRAMGEWLGDTLDAVKFTAEKMQQARAAPKIVMREMHAYALGLADETGAILERARRAPAAGKRSASAGAPPSSNTGGKTPTAGEGKARRAGRP
jgi:hypothetical protein